MDQPQTPRLKEWTAFKPLRPAAVHIKQPLVSVQNVREMPSEKIRKQLLAAYWVD